MNQSNGTFVAVRFAEKTMEELEVFAKMIGVPNPIPRSDYHCTVIYSRKPLINVVPEKSILPFWFAEPLGFDVFDTRSSDGSTTKCLVLKISSDEMHERHTYFREVEGASHDFDSYIPHITLSYDIGDYDISVLGCVELPRICIVQEYSEELKDEDRRKEAREEETR
jgi:hypothetical protein